MSVKMHDTSLALTFDNGLVYSIAQGEDPTRPTLGCTNDTAEVAVWRAGERGAMTKDYRTAEGIAEDIAGIARGEMPDWAMVCSICDEPAGACECRTCDVCDLQEPASNAPDWPNGACPDCEARA